MMSSKELPEDKRKYVFFSDPDIVAKRAESTAAALQSQYPREHQDVQQVAAYPFTFITAVKRKLALAAQNEACKRIYSPDPSKPLDPSGKPLDPERMDLIKPLKVPDLRISPKTVEYSPRENAARGKGSNAKDQKIEKSPKISLARKLDFSGSEGTSFITSDEVEPLKPPDISFTPSLTKKKDHLRDSSREKENRKRIKKDDSSFSKGDDSSDTLKRRNFKHISRRDLETIIQKSSKNEKFHSNARDAELTDLIMKKSQKKVVSSSTAKKDARSSSSHSGKVRERSLEGRGRTFSSESATDRSLKPRESRGSGSENSKYEEHGKHRAPKRLSDKSKERPSTSKMHHRYSTSEISEEMEGPSETNSIKLSKKPKDTEKLEQKTDRPPAESSDELFLDPRKISFRDDSYSQQDEFSNLITPDLNLVYRPKRKKDTRQTQEKDEKPRESENVPLVHPTALHMQFQAELHLFDSYNESLRQVMDVENCLYNVKQDKEREALQKALLPPPQPVPPAQEAKPHEELKDKQREEVEVEARKTAKEVQTQTVNDIATQTEVVASDKPKYYPGITYNRGGSVGDVGQLSLNSIDEFEDLDRLEEISLPSKIRTMSEISLHETTSSIKTETGTEISISTRDVTCSFNKYLDHEMAQLIKDEKQMYDKIEMLFKSREKTLNDRTRKLVKLEEQKRALRDTGQDSRISSVKKKQRALLLKLQQEKEEMNRLKELHKLASQERKLMLQKQRNMFNPQMSTKNILTKLKRSADCQSPRRLSGPMKGYDIRSNSSVSSLLDSDKSQLDRSRTSIDKMGPKTSNPLEESSNSSQVDTPQKYELKTRKFEEKMPKGDLLRLKAHHFDLESKLLQARQGGIPKILPGDVHQEEKTESDTLVEDLTKKNGKVSIDVDAELARRSKGVQVSDEKLQNKGQIPSEPKLNAKRKGTKNLKSKTTSSAPPDGTVRSRITSEDVLKHSKKSRLDRDSSLADGNDRNSILEELELNDSQNSLQALVKHSRAVKEKNYKLLKDIAVENEAKELQNDENDKAQRNEHEEVAGVGNISTRSQVSTFTISRHSSGDSEKSYSRSVVIRSQDHRFKASKKLEQVLNAREAALATRRNCVEDWIAWHARLKAEESRVARMEEAAYKLVSATTNALCNDTTLSSDTSDVEGRVELLAEKLTERRAEMAKLRREARRQAKQRLKALEANLLNQIKKYDTTIHEMRKKLDSKRGLVKENGKLAIEAKNVADFKVPELPIKRIQEIYRNSDLLRSRSESDLITGSGITRSSTSNVQNSSRSIESVLEEARNHSSRRSTKASPEVSKTQGTEDINTMLDSKRSTSQQNSEILSEISPKNSTNLIAEESKDEDSIFSRKIDFLPLNNKNLNDDINTLENDLKTLSEMMSKFSKKSDEKLRSVYTPLSEREDTVAGSKSTSKDITEDLPKSDTIDTEPESITEVISNQSPRSSEVQSEINSPSKVPTITEVPSDMTEVISAIIPEEKSLKLNEEIDFEARSKEILNEIEKSIISEHVKSSGSNLELCGAALEKTMEDLHKENEALSSHFTSLEGDIKSISEIISKMTENKESLSAPDYTKDKDFVPEVSTAVDHRVETSIPSDEVQTLEEVASEAQEIEEKSRVETSELQDESQDVSRSTVDDQKKSIDEEPEEEDSIQRDEAGNESSLISQKYSEQEIISEKDERSLNEPDWPVSDSFDVPKVFTTAERDEKDDEEEEVEHESEERSVDNTQSPNLTNDIEVSLFLPRGESTTIDGRERPEDSHLDDTAKPQDLQTDELDDILDIIQRDSHHVPEQQSAISPEVPDELQLEIRDDLVPPATNELNLTADVAPVLQKLTEVLISVERNIARRTEAKNTPSPSEVSSKELQSLEENIDINDENLVETDIDEKVEMNQHLDEALNQLNFEEKNQEQSGKNEVIEEIQEEAKEPEAPTPKVPEIIKDPEYEDISEESLEVSEILDRSESQRSTQKSSKSTKIPEKYEAVQKSDDVLRILDEISQKSNYRESTVGHVNDIEVKVQVFGSISPGDVPGVIIEEVDTSEIQEKSSDSGKIAPVVEEPEDASRRAEDTEESSDGGDTPREISEIDLDSPRDQNESRLDIEALDDDLLGSADSVEKDEKLKFHPGGGLTSSEKDIEVLIDKLKASLEQPGLDVAELDARLLRIEQLQIELQIKKLEAEEVSFYVREIPNKPPPPYTPPGAIRLTSPQTSPTIPPAVVPTNVEELTAFTEKATAIIYTAKAGGEEIMSLEAPLEILESNKDSNEISKKDRRIYNTFLFDLCKETIAEVYQSEYEKPGPSWTKPNVKTKPAMKIPKSVDELTEYVNKEVATLFGFKTKLQRENMVMRWSRKRRDRVDELLAREAQAEEDEWTKFHHDELAVKNDLTLAILDTLIMETTSVIKATFTKKQKIFV